MAKTPRGRNLFAIDQASIESTLAEANGALISGRDKLLRAFRTIPESLDTIEDIDKAKAFTKDLDDLLSEAKKARLSDGKPFTEAGKTVKDFFARIEGPLKATMDEILHRVTQAALRQQRMAAEEARRAAAAEAAARRGADVLPLRPPAAPEPVALVRGQSGASVITKVEPSANIPLVWIVEAFDRDAIDLEALRPYLTDAAILAACKKHLDAHGPNKLAGVTYDQEAEV
ncbi:MAG: hypothetical protein KIT43_08200 [Bauldia sp.]|nr:hypothetical protein [Bauldia sp.]